MPDSGIETPYWYEMKIGLIECLKMMSDVTIESVTLQSSAFQSLDDVVIKYNNGKLKNIQVKHTENEKSYLNYSFLENELNKWASEWLRERTTYLIEKICITTNKPFGPNETGGRCSIADFVSKVLPKIKNDILTGYNASEQSAIEWFKEKLAENYEKGKPIFVFLHQHLEYPNSSWIGIQQAEELREILSEYSEVVLFSSHTHRDIDENSISLNKPFTIVNTGAIHYTLVIDSYGRNGVRREDDYINGIYVEVNGNVVSIKARDIKEKQWRYKVEVSN